MGGTIGGLDKGSDKDLADQLDAEDRLRNRGYVKVGCARCHGLGFTIESGLYTLTCGSCDGRGYYWQSPLTKSIVTTLPPRSE